MNKVVKDGDFVILEPLSDNTSIERQVSDKKTEIKMVGRFGKI